MLSCCSAWAACGAKTYPTSSGYRWWQVELFSRGITPARIKALPRQLSPFSRTSRKPAIRMSRISLSRWITVRRRRKHDTEVSRGNNTKLVHNSTWLSVGSVFPGSNHQLQYWTYMHHVCPQQRSRRWRATTVATKWQFGWIWYRNSTGQETTMSRCGIIISGKRRTTLIMKVGWKTTKN